jgi:hypothetical protein
VPECFINVIDENSKVDDKFYYNNFTLVDNGKRLIFLGRKNIYELNLENK